MFLLPRYKVPLDCTSLLKVHSTPYIATDSNPVAILPIGTYVTNIFYILNLSYRIWCLASPANHPKLDMHLWKV